MSSGLIISDAVDWIVAGWAGDHAIDLIIQRLDPDSDAQLIERLRDGLLYPGSLGNLTDAESERMRSLYVAAKRAYLQATQTGPAGWAQPNFYTGFMDRFADLLALLEADPRVGSE